jgi:hypothetical protein
MTNPQTKGVETMGMEAGHTPLPWHVGGDSHMVGSGAGHIIAYDPELGRLDNGRAAPAIILTANPNLDQSDANAALIVHRVNTWDRLVAALERAKRQLALTADWLVAEDFDDQDERHAIKMIDAALTEARNAA